MLASKRYRVCSLKLIQQKLGMDSLFLWGISWSYAMGFPTSWVPAHVTFCGDGIQLPYVMVFCEAHFFLFT